MTYEIIGKVLFSQNTFFDSLIPLGNIQVVLRNTSSNNAICVSTDPLGQFRIFNIPSGNYELIESYGYNNPFLSPADFNSSSIITGAIPEKDPFISSIHPTPIGTKIFSLTPNTVFLSTSSFINNIKEVDFVDSTYFEVPFLSNNKSFSDTNLVKFEYNGTFGTNLPGTLSNTNRPSANSIPNFIYSPYSTTLPKTNGYSIVNIGNLYTNANSNYNFANHTTNIETGNLLLLNNNYGYLNNTKNVFYFETFNALNINTEYFFSFWISPLNRNISNDILEISLEIKDGNNIIISDNVIYSALDYGQFTWEQVGYTLNTLSNTSLTLTLYSYNSINKNILLGIDEISLREIYPESPLLLSKTGYYSNDLLNPEINYQITLKNTSNLINIYNLYVDDILPSNCIFKYGSGILDGVTLPGTFPFKIDTLAHSTTSTLSFIAQITSNLKNTPCNIAMAKYSYLINSTEYTLTTKTEPFCLPPLVIEPEVYLVVSENACTLKEPLKYTLNINNFNNVDFLDVSIIDELPTSVKYIENSLSINGITIPNESVLPPNGLYLGTLPSLSSNSISFFVLPETIPSPNLISNSMNIYFQNPTTKSMTFIESNTVVTNVYQVLFNSTLNAIPTTAKKNIPITFFSSLTNTGNILATSIVAFMTIPDGFSLMDNSIIIDNNGFGLTKSYIHELLLNNNFLISLPDLYPGNSVSFSFQVVPIEEINYITPFLMNYLSYFNYVSLIAKTSIYVTSSQQVFITSSGNSVSIERFANGVCFKRCDIIIFTVVVSNSPNSFSPIDCTLFEKISCNTSFIKGSIYIDGIRSGVSNPSLGIPVHSIPVGKQVKVTYSVKATSCGVSNSHSIAIIDDGGVAPIEILSNISKIIIK
ncbi:MAG: carboxypeptidase-like regulatory domain-containing protein [Clostridium sp.]